MAPHGTEAWKAYLRGSTLYFAAFLGVYLGCNAWAASRAAPLPLHLAVEMRIPFVPSFLWIYLSPLLLWPLQPLRLEAEAIRGLTRRLLLALLLAAPCFLLVPARLGFPRVLPEDPVLAQLYGLLHRVDAPHNLVPSLHVASAALVLLAFRDATPAAWLRFLWMLWLGLIALSALLVHQHHLLDVALGFLLGAALHRGPVFSSSPRRSAPAPSAEAG